MKMPGTELARICKLLELAPNRPGLPSSTFIAVDEVGEAVRFRISSDLSVSVSVPGTLGLSTPCGVDRRILFPFVVEEGEYDLQVKDNHLIVKQGSRHAEIQTVDIDWGYSEWESSEQETITLQSELLDAIQCARLCAETDPMFAELNCVYVEFSSSTYIFSSNDLVMCFGRVGTVPSKGVLFVPLPLIDVLIQEKIPDPELLVSASGMGVQILGGQIWAQVPEQARTAFPVKQIKRLIIQSRDSQSVLSLGVKDLASVCRQFCKYLTNIPRQEWALEIAVGSDNTVELVSSTSVARFRDVVEVRKVFRPEKMELNLAVLSSVLGFLEGRVEEVQFSTFKQMYHLNAGQYEFLLSKRL